MNTDEFEKVFDRVVEDARNVLINKAREYATDNDRLHNFDVAAKLAGCTNVEAVGGMMIKHVVSVFDMIRDYGNDIHHSKAVWDEKIGDNLNYLILLQAVLAESRKGESESGLASRQHPNILPVNSEDIRGL